MGLEGWNGVHMDSVLARGNGQPKKLALQQIADSLRIKSDRRWKG
jgi:hypothetical protein